MPLEFAITLAKNPNIHTYFWFSLPKGNSCIWRVRWLYEVTSPGVRQTAEQFSFSGGPQHLLNLSEYKNERKT